MGKVITVWGSPGSGKSMFSCILAKALTRDKRKAIIINAEISVCSIQAHYNSGIVSTLGKPIQAFHPIRVSGL